MIYIALDNADFILIFYPNCLESCLPNYIFREEKYIFSINYE